MAEQYYTLPDGLYVTSVEENSDAYKGIREGDIITEANGTPVASIEDMNAIKETMAVGTPSFSPSIATKPLLWMWS